MERREVEISWSTPRSAFICPSFFGGQGAGRKEKWLGVDGILHPGNWAFDAEAFDIDDEEWRTPNGGQSGMGIMAVSRELCSNGYSCSGFVDRRATIPLARGLLGADHDFGDYTIIARCRSLRLLRAVHGNGAWRSSWSDRNRFLWTEYAYLRCQCFCPGTPERRSKLESECIPIRRRDACRCAACTAGGTSMAHRVSSIRRSVYRPCGGTDIVSGMARTGGSALKQDVKVRAL